MVAPRSPVSVSRSLVSVSRSVVSVSRSLVSAGHLCLSVTRVCLSVTRVCLTVTRVCILITRICLSVSRVCLSITRVYFSVTLVGLSRFYSNCVRCTAPSWRRFSGAEPQGTSRPPGTPSLAICRTCWLPRRRRNKATVLQTCRRTHTVGAVPLDPLHTRTCMRTRHRYSP